MSVDHVVVDAVLDERTLVAASTEPLMVGLVLSEQPLGRGIRQQIELAELVMTGDNRIRVGLPQRRAFLRRAPRPGIAEPERRQKVQRGRGRSAVPGGDA